MRPTLAHMLHGNNKQITIPIEQWVENTFDSNSWVILSPIEQSIKSKIEKYGTPLRDWDIKINRGVLTGCNEAFIISTEKRDEILANCKTKEERKRTDEIIRPILRGRDIKRYKYDWKGLWLINTHNGVKGKFPRVDIKDYPAVKQWLDKGGEAYNGKIYHGYKDIEKRADQGDTPYNLRNCAYLDDFFKPKIMFQELTQGSAFCYDPDASYLVSNTGYILTGPDLEYLTACLNSKIIEFCFRRFYSTSMGKTGMRWLYQYVINLPIPPQDTSCDFGNIENVLIKAFHLTQDEVSWINENA